MKTIVRVVTLFAVLLFAGAAQAQQTNPGCYTADAISTTGRTLLFTAIGDAVLNFSGSYYTTGSPAAVSVAIETGNQLAATQAPFSQISALTDTTGAAFTDSASGRRYWYVNVATLNGGTSPTVLVSYCLRPVETITNSQLIPSMTSATLAAQLTDETGTGLATFATSPTFTTDISIVGATPIVLEGVTANDFETNIAVTDPTADATFTIPTTAGTNAAFMLSTLTTNTLDAANGIWAASNALIFEGSTANDFELSVAPTNVGADVTATLPGAGNANYAILPSLLTTNDVDVVNSVWAVSNGLRLEGATANAFETTLTPTDVGAAVTATIPGGANANFAFFLSTLTTNDVDAANGVWAVSNGLRLEGVTANDFETTVSPTDVGADVAVTLPGGGDAAYALFPTTLTTNDVNVANSVWGVSNGLAFEGATGNDFETTISSTDVGADVAVTLPGGANAAYALFPSTLTTNDVGVANSVWGISGGLKFEGSSVDGNDLTITVTNPAADTTVTIPAIASGAVTLGTIEVSFIDQVTGDATDRRFFVATKGYIVNACTEVHATAAGGASTMQITKDASGTGPGAGTDLLTAAFDLNSVANTPVAKTSGDFVSLAARTLATGDSLSIDHADAIQASAGIVVTCSLLPN